MPKYAISLYPGRKVSLEAYIAAWKQLKLARPELRVKEGPGGWWSMTAAEALAGYRHGVMDRINRHIPGYGVGRKWSNDWQRNALQTAARLNTPRLIIDWLPSEFRQRFAHRLRPQN